MCALALFDVRPATDDDAVSLSAFLNSCTLFHQGISRSSPSDVMARIGREGSDPRLDSFVVRDGGTIVGFAHLWPHGTDEVKLFARTLPDARGRGVGGRLLRLCEMRAATLRPGARRSTTSWSADGDAPPLLRRHGFRQARLFVKMEIEADAIADEPITWPAGVEPTSLSERPTLAPGLYAAWRDAFTDHWQHPDESEREFWQQRRDAKLESAFAFDPALWLLACEGATVVGFCLCELGSNEGEPIGRVSEIGVVRSRRGAGVGCALLRQGLGVLSERGAARAVLDVDAENVTSALRLYEKVGMTPHPAFTVWEKP